MDGGHGSGERLGGLVSNGCRENSQIFRALGLAGFAIIEDGSTWNETFLNLYNDRVLGNGIRKPNKNLRFFEGYIGHYLN